MNLDNINYLVNHLFLPPKLPDKSDRSLDRQNALLSHVVESAETFCQQVDRAEVDMRVRQCWNVLYKMLRSMQEIRQGDDIPSAWLKAAVNDMQVHDILSLHISKQNSGMILRKLESEITLEFFQASPTAAAVTGNRGKLIVQFPSRPRLSIPNNPRAIESFCAYLAHMDCTEMLDARPDNTIAGAPEGEYREVADIRYISELLGGIARALTSDIDSVASSTIYVTKRINDHALSKGAPDPWRRDPQWLIIRVALQTSLSEWKVDERYGYKAFITYVLARALEKACGANIDHHLLYTMNVKIATRVWKLQPSEPPSFPFDYIVSQSHSCASLLEHQWQAIQAFEAQPLMLTPPTRDEICEAEGFPLARSTVYLSEVYNRSSQLQSHDSRFSPDEFEASLVRNKPRQNGLSPPAQIPEEHTSVDLWLAITDVENWIVNGLPGWLIKASEHTRVTTLTELITDYQTIAYSFNNPESFSRVFLIVLELWTALDRMAIESIPMLAEYSPELSASSFEPLILPKLNQMTRLRAVEDYFQSRHNRAKFPNLSLFKFINDPHSLPARYFEGDENMQALRSRIQSEATRDKDAKLQERERLEGEYHRLQRESDGLEHDYIHWVDRRGYTQRTHQSWKCSKCAIQRRADNLRISVFEWPLPEDEILSRLVIFELCMPESFVLWRDITYRLVRHDSFPGAPQIQSLTVLHDYPPLKKFSSLNSPTQKLTIASGEKSFLKSDYKECKFPCDEDAVIKRHPLRYELYDVATQEWLPSKFPTLRLRERCAPELPPGPYSSLAWTVGSTLHTPNMVISRQSECPAELSYHEWESFGYLRSGHRLQWRNMMLELVKGTLNFSDPNVYLLFRQAAWQVEKRANMDHRESHLELAETFFGKELVTVLRDRLEKICDNWQEGWTAATLGILACRLFSLSGSSMVRKSVLIFLASLRGTVYKWMNQVLHLLKNRDSQADLTAQGDLRNRVIQLAATCRSTYALDFDEISCIIDDQQFVSIFTECGIVLQDNLPTSFKHLSTPLQYMVERDTALAIELSAILRRAIFLDGSGLEEGIRRVWQGFRRDPSVPWRFIGDRWIACQTLVQGDADQICYVYLNLLDGAFLVDGRELGTLPKNILQHPLFQSLFPRQFTMEVVPSTMKGMAYQLRSNVHKGLEVHFSLTGENLLIRTRDLQSNTVSEFVPVDNLQGDVPDALLINTVLLFHDASQSLQFYPGLSGWNPSSLPTWTIRFAADPSVTTASHPRLTKSTPDCIPDTVLSPDSRVLKILYNIFQPLETSVTKLLVTWKQPQAPTGHFPPYSGGDLEISLPRYNLSFFVGVRGDIECKELPGLSISGVQSIGTLFGLKSKLVLDSKDNNATRKVIVPDGNITVSRGRQAHKSHPEITVAPPQGIQTHVKIFVYDVDELLGRLIGDDTLTSWYLLAYLHILTSSHLRDPLTDRTGGQQALAMLESPYSFAFMELTVHHMRFLRLISNVTPVRKQYPPHRGTWMEEVDWHPVLSPLSQSDSFVPLVQAILEHGTNQALFQPNAASIGPWHEGTAGLRERAELRNSRLTSQKLYGQKQLDYFYFPTHCLDANLQPSNREDLVTQTATLVGRWTSHPDIPQNLWKEFQSWREFSTRTDADISLDSPNAWFSKSPAETWFSLFSLCLSASREHDTYGLMFTLGIISYRANIELKLVHALLAMATSTPSLRPLFQKAARLLPVDQFLDLDTGHTLEVQEIETLAKKYCIPFESSPQARQGDSPGESLIDIAERNSDSYRLLCEEQCQSLAKVLAQQWPNPVAEMPKDSTDTYYLIDAPSFYQSIRGLFSSRFLNHNLFGLTVQLQSALEQISSPQEYLPKLPECPSPPKIIAPCPRYVHVTLWSLIHSHDRRPPSFADSPEVTKCQRDVTLGSTGLPVESSIRALILRLSEGDTTGFLSRYTHDLLRCVDALEGRSVSDSGDSHPCVTSVASETIRDALRPQTVSEETLSAAGLWPSLGPISLLHQLSSHLREGIRHEWQKALTLYARELASAQRERRLMIFKRLGLGAEYVKEIDNRWGKGWDPLTYPDWVLIQLDADMLIRPVQAYIAKEMMSPRCQRNTVMQLKMGEGKSSVIVPIASAVLADGEKLVRIIVPKPLCAQMFHLLKRRVCGLVGRRLFYLPFTRNVSLSPSEARKMFDVLKACAISGGVLLCQPEHILSFQLTGLHSLCHSVSTKQSEPLIEAQQWLDRVTRDILDESDEILNVSSQLIYTIGPPRPLQGQPDRWRTTQDLFSLLKDNLTTMASWNSEWLELEHLGPARFPWIRILNQGHGRNLLSSIAHQIVFEDRMPSTRFSKYPKEVRNIAFRFLTHIGITSHDSNILENYSGGYFDQLLLLRGLIAHGILLLVLTEKRWRVDYGLDLSRSMLAVPYRAKDCPAPRAEFGHPDMILVLTCLSYYYGGLSDQQVETTFQHLLSTDSPALRYEDWIKGFLTELPKSLHSLRGLNLNDADQKNHHVYPRLRYNKAVIDFYLSECVFPKEAKEFQYKLTTNSWDLAREKTNLTTGFSGTNDHSYLLPLSMHQLDSQEQRHTNAQVLEHLLRVENRNVILLGSNVTALHLIERVVEQEPHVMVLLDVGAQVLELQNDAVARAWLERDTRPTVAAAIYCDPRNDEFYVLSRDGRIEPLVSSLYRTQLDKTLVYLDDARTRGTDFKFPVHTRAVVTLGPKLSKDKLVQGCMRMRELGNGHSVLFFASSEIWRRIQSCIGDVKTDLNSSDVLIWTMLETCTQIKANGALWASQGLNFDTRRTAWEKYSMHLLSASIFADVLQEQESRTLQELYGVRSNETPFSPAVATKYSSERRDTIHRRCAEFGISLSKDNALLEEQERELAREKEVAKEVNRVLPAEPLEHNVDPNLWDLIQWGTISPRFFSLADCLEGTSRICVLLETSRVFFQSRNLRATRDFSRTIRLTPSLAADDFLRPVQWVLRSNSQPDFLLLISPFEANALLPNIRESKHARLHLYSPRVSRESRSLEGLDLSVVPRPLQSTPAVHRSMLELNLFAGQLFFSDKRSFKEVCNILGLYLSTIPDTMKGIVDPGGFVRDSRARRTLGIRGCMFDASPVAFLRGLIEWRRKRHSFTLTHLGQILYGSDLQDSELN